MPLDVPQPLSRNEAAVRIRVFQAVARAAVMFCAVSIRNPADHRFRPVDCKQGGVRHVYCGVANSGRNVEAVAIMMTGGGGIACSGISKWLIDPQSAGLSMACQIQAP